MGLAIFIVSFGYVQTAAYAIIKTNMLPRPA